MEIFQDHELPEAKYGREGNLLQPPTTSHHQFIPLHPKLTPPQLQIRGPQPPAQTRRPPVAASPSPPSETRGTKKKRQREEEDFDQEVMGFPEKQPDAEELFLLSLAPRLRSLSEERRSSVEIEIMLNFYCYFFSSIYAHLRAHLYARTSTCMHIHTHSVFNKKLLSK